jgi:hypothetical protein
LLASRIRAGRGDSETTIPKETGTETFSQPKIITGNFNGGFKKYGHGLQCKNNIEGGEVGAVFIVEDSGTIEACLPFTLYPAAHFTPTTTYIPTL